MEIITIRCVPGNDYVNSTVSAQHAANIEYDWLAARYGLPHRLDSHMVDFFLIR